MFCHEDSGVGLVEDPPPVLASDSLALLTAKFMSGPLDVA